MAVRIEESPYGLDTGVDCLRFLTKIELERMVWGFAGDGLGEDGTASGEVRLTSDPLLIGECSLDL